MSDKKLVIAHIGNGKSTNRYHLPFSLNRPDKIKVKSIYQRSLSKKSDWEKIDGVEYTDDLEKILQDSEIDVVVVNTPCEAHYSMAKKVLSAGKHCVIEKPFATNVEDAAELFRLAKEKNITVQCYQNRRFDSDFLTTQKVIESGRLGKIFEVCMHYDYYRAEVPESVKTFNRDTAFLFTHGCHTVSRRKFAATFGNCSAKVVTMIISIWIFFMMTSKFRCSQVISEQKFARVLRFTEREELL